MFRPLGSETTGAEAKGVNRIPSTTKVVKRKKRDSDLEEDPVDINDTHEKVNADSHVIEQEKHVDHSNPQ